MPNINFFRKLQSLHRNNVEKRAINCKYTVFDLTFYEEKKMAKMEKPMNKTELYGSIAEDTGLTKKQVSEVFDSLSAKINGSLGKGGCGKFVLPGLMKVEVKNIPAKPARKGVPNPFKPGETMDVPAKPASKKIVVRALKNLKDMA